MPARKRARAEAPVETATLTDPDEHHPTFRQLATLWRAGQLCDVTFTVEGRSFSAHKLVLAAASAYVRALVDGPRFADSSSDALTLDEMPAAAFELLLEWIYSGSCNAPLNLLQPLLLAAGRLQVPALEMAAAQAERLDATNCSDLWAFAERAALVDLAAAAKAFALNHFQEIAGDAAFLNLPRAQLEVLISSDDIALKEELVFENLMLWLAAQPAEAREPDEVAKLLEHIRFATMERAFITARVQPHELMQSMPAYKVLADALADSCFGAGTARSAPRGGSCGWLLEGLDCGDKVTAEGRVLTFKAGAYRLVRLDKLISSGKWEIGFELVADSAGCRRAATVFGLVARDGGPPVDFCLKTSASIVLDNAYMLRRHQRLVYANGTMVGEGDGQVGQGESESYAQFPVGSLVRIIADMDKREATFSIDGTAVTAVARGISGPVYPFVGSYHSAGPDKVIAFKHVRRLA
ncbi:hypothetical protein EMIHUDRAFT_214981 [Emiliania huxleyi CCMP1516]|uniref:BTB domain-containing protein n=2 Tax=Emiliania huxleyi TaxID=2903 RepID=A0A0D3IIQ6_EMIH1|nr:hypothetical protein EMIHUDRAFT_214981 [Emiliania huxleyi CCMP1516]EOD11141.1 hypothetical protein EMIHUDRAFT_214981 [Emiliania huxleyi CCMP1516]|eukprot:XP_005763570.1 hypothetical protein EMIHUDRAFT_214981 [Emiliania huxleyi CCMP1516]